VDVGAQEEELRLARNVVEAFLKRRLGLQKNRVLDCN